MSHDIATALSVAAGSSLAFLLFITAIAFFGGVTCKDDYVFFLKLSRNAFIIIFTFAIIITIVGNAITYLVAL